MGRASGSRRRRAGSWRGLAGLAGLGVLLGVLATAGAAAGAAGACASPPKPPALVPGRVERVVDGDTLIVRLGDGRRERVRLIGIDTPEVHRSAKLVRDVARTGQDEATIQGLGRRASAYTARALLGQAVELEGDVQARDRHGRRLAHLWGPDGTLFNLAIVRDGYAQTYPVPPNLRYEARFRACQQEARRAGRGLWAGQDLAGIPR